MKRSWLTIALGLAACGPKAPEASTPMPASSAGGPVIAPTPSAAPTEPAEPAPAPEAKPATNCPPADEGGSPSGMCTLCSPRGAKLLLQLVPADTITIPMGASIIAQSPAAKSPRDLEYTVVVTKDRLVAQIFTCPGCRRRMGWGFDVALEDLRALDDDNRRALQKAVGVAETPLLGTIDEWAAANVTGPPNGTPSLPGCAPRS